MFTKNFIFGDFEGLLHRVFKCTVAVLPISRYCFVYAKIPTLRFLLSRFSWMHYPSVRSSACQVLDSATHPVSRKTIRGTPIRILDFGSAVRPKIELTGIFVDRLWHSNASAPSARKCFLAFDLIHGLSKMCALRRTFVFSMLWKRVSATLVSSG